MKRDHFFPNTKAPEIDPIEFQTNINNIHKLKENENIFLLFRTHQAKPKTVFYDLGETEKENIVIFF
uniref:Uncharacterized protein n=1 Tax=Panagrolaimus sp. ES5 TaxID=591445 RepID=A0AC34GSM1_9BILA